MLNSTQEEWKEIPGYERLYEISTAGVVRNMRKKVIKDFAQNAGYRFTRLCPAPKVSKNHTIHRLVAMTFMPVENPSALQVNHLNGVKSDNRVENLEWVTNQQNRDHALKHGLWKYNVPTTGKKLGKTSMYRNVTKTSRGKWSAVVMVKGKAMHKRVFNTEIEAARHVNWIIDTLGLTDRVRNDV